MTTTIRIECQCCGIDLRPRHYYVYHYEDDDHDDLLITFCVPCADECGHEAPDEEHCPKDLDQDAHCCHCDHDEDPAHLCVRCANNPPRFLGICRDCWEHVEPRMCLGENCANYVSLRGDTYPPATITTDAEGDEVVLCPDCHRNQEAGYATEHVVPNPCYEDEDTDTD